MVSRIKNIDSSKEFNFGAYDTNKGDNYSAKVFNLSNSLIEGVNAGIKHSIETIVLNNRDLYVDNMLETKIEAGFDVDDYNKKLETELSNAKGTRNKVVAAATFLSTKFPQLPYFWGGGHELSKDDMLGINPKWGSSEVCQFGGAEPYYVAGKEYPYSLDCSGFTSWCLINAGFKDIDGIWNTNEFYNNSKTQAVSITDATVMDKVQPGDFGYMAGHIGVVIEVNQDSHEITFAHVSGDNGMNITTMSTDNGLITKDNIGKNDSNINRTGVPYFTDILLMDYPD